MLPASRAIRCRLSVRSIQSNGYVKVWPITSSIARPGQTHSDVIILQFPLSVKLFASLLLRLYHSPLALLCRYSPRLNPKSTLLTQEHSSYGMAVPPFIPFLIRISYIVAQAINRRHWVQAFVTIHMAFARNLGWMLPIVRYRRVTRPASSLILVDLTNWYSTGVVGRLDAPSLLVALLQIIKRAVEVLLQLLIADYKARLLVSACQAHLFVRARI